MQNRYVADIGDFGKYGLLRHLIGVDPTVSSPRLGIVWWLTPDETHNNDGARTQYLFTNRSNLAECDPWLFRQLRSIVLRGQRDVREVRRRRLLGAATSYFETLLSFSNAALSTQANDDPPRYARADLRNSWLRGALGATLDRDVVFLDPDNGLECKSVGRYASKGPKYVYCDELVQFIDRGQAIVLYHHNNRTASAQLQIAECLSRLVSLTPSHFPRPFAMRFRRGGSRVFFILPTRCHYIRFRRRSELMMKGPWGKHFDMIDC